MPSSPTKCAWTRCEEEGKFKLRLLQYCHDHLLEASANYDKSAVTHREESERKTNPRRHERWLAFNRSLNEQWRASNEYRRREEKTRARVLAEARRIYNWPNKPDHPGQSCSKNALL